MNTVTVSSPREIPLSYPQYLLAFLDALYPGEVFGPYFTISIAYRMNGMINVEDLRFAVHDVIERHSGLRTTISRGPGVPFQKISIQNSDRLVVKDLYITHGSSRDEVANDFLAELESNAYSAVDPPLLWVFVGRFDAEDAVFCIIVHHTVADEWSLQLLARDLGVCYSARRAGITPILPLASQYSDYTFSQLAGDNYPFMSRASKYWTKKLAGVSALPMPTSRARPTCGSGSKNTLRFEIGASTATRISILSKTFRVSEFMVLLTAYKAFLYRLTGADDIVVPTLMSGRERPDVQHIVGFFLNALVLRTSLADCRSLKDVLKRVRTTCLDAYTHEVPLLWMIDEITEVALLLADKRFILMPFQLIQVPYRAPDHEFGADLTCRPITRRTVIRADGPTLPLDGLWTISQTIDGLLGSVSYSTDLFDESFIESMVAGFLVMLDRLLDQPEAKVDSVDLP